MRQAYIDRFYEILDRNLRARPAFPLSALHSSSLRNKLELRGGGVYFAFERGEARQNGAAKRVVRVGKADALYNRFVRHAWLSDESAFFDLVWQACAAQKRRSNFTRWLRKPFSQIPNPPAADMLKFEDDVVLPHMRLMEFTWVPCDARAQADIEKNATILLSNRWKPPIDPPSAHWLGRAAPPPVRDSGLWSKILWQGNTLAPAFLNRLDRLVP